MEKMQWFKFSISEWKMGKIQRCTPEAKSVFIELCCLYWINETKLLIEDAIIECDEDNYQNLLSKKVIKEVDGYVKIYFLDEQFENVLEKSEKARESVKNRWAKRNATVLDLNNDGNTNVSETYYERNTEEKRREEDKEIKNITIPEFSEFLAYALLKKPKVNQQDLRLKYESWKESNWSTNKNGKLHPIFNWKTTLLNTLPYIKEVVINVQRQIID